ncbi:AAA family ATPase, partial [Curtobacterium flaccumfaciens]|uniref:AAA family ATPase n=1 Tax=Curtobacterium flaccumfaciens TaxID=2035 RepID=UPI003CED5915
MSIENGAFKRLVVEGWRQFESIDIAIHPRLTILTGANGCGKTTLINLFARNFGVHREYLATPKVDKEG